MAFKKIVVPVDFSEFSNKAAEYAMFIAEKFCADITLLHAVILFEEDIDEKEQLQAYKKIIQKKEKERTKQLELHCKTAKSRGLRVKSALIRGVSTADSILDYISDNDFDLMVMGTHGRTGLKRWMLGSVTERVAGFSPIPVLTIHKDFKELDITKILIPIDFSEHSKIAINRGIAIAKEFNAALEFLHVVEMQAHPEFYTISSDSILKENPELEHHITKNMIKLTGIPKEKATYSVKEGKVYKEIKMAAENNHIDLIVMATHGMSELEHFLVGSNCERVIRIAPCPVLTVRQKS
jgi:nucleotide-binding universal stress UspA family protein